MRHKLTDDQCKLITDIFPPSGKTRLPQGDRHPIVDGILCILRTGSPWRDLLNEFGPWETYYGCFDRWKGNGALDKLLQRLRAARVDIGEITEDLWCVTGSIVRVHHYVGSGEKRIRKSRLIMY